MEKKEFKLTDTKNIKFNFFKGNLYYHSDLDFTQANKNSRLVYL